jgi:hypothetical protein
MLINSCVGPHIDIPSILYFLCCVRVWKAGICSVSEVIAASWSKITQLKDTSFMSGTVWFEDIRSLKYAARKRPNFVEHAYVKLDVHNLLPQYETEKRWTVWIFLLHSRNICSFTAWRRHQIQVHSKGVYFFQMCSFLFCVRNWQGWIGLSKKCFSAAPCCFGIRHPHITVKRRSRANRLSYM